MAAMFEEENERFTVKVPIIYTDSKNCAQHITFKLEILLW